MPLVKKLPDSTLWVFFCPGCGYDHGFDSRWTFNGDVDKPTFKPSLLVNAQNFKLRCHLYVTDGKIKYLTDCYHSLKGQTIQMEDYDLS